MLDRDKSVASPIFQISAHDYFATLLSFGGCVRQQSMKVQVRSHHLLLWHNVCRDVREKKNMHTSESAECFDPLSKTKTKAREAGKVYCLVHSQQTLFLSLLCVFSACQVRELKTTKKLETAPSQQIYIKCRLYVCSACQAWELKHQQFGSAPPSQQIYVLVDV